MIIACVVHPEDGIDDVLKRETGGTESTLKQFAKRFPEDYHERIILV